MWAPNENNCEKPGLYEAKIAAVSLPGNSKEERIRFVEGTIYRSKHISKIKECFAKGNAWIVISFDCLKGLEILKKKLKKKEIEWYKVIFDEYKKQEKPTGNSSSKEELQENFKGSVERSNNRGKTNNDRKQ